jgi:hypothetical protein
MTSPTIIDVDPIRTVPGGAEDLVGDEPQIDLAPGGPETSGAQVPPSSSSSSPRLLLTVKIRQPSHEFTFGVGISFIPYPLVLAPVV